MKEGKIVPFPKTVGSVNVFDKVGPTVEINGACKLVYGPAELYGLGPGPADDPLGPGRVNVPPYKP